MPYHEADTESKLITPLWAVKYYGWQKGTMFVHVCVSSCKFTCVLCSELVGTVWWLPCTRQNVGKLKWVTILLQWQVSFSQDCVLRPLWGVVVPFQDHQQFLKRNLGCFRLHVGTLQTNLWCLWLPALILEVALEVDSSYSWFQLRPIGPSVRICCHAGRRTSRKMLLCLHLPEVLGSCLLCLYPESALVESCSISRLLCVCLVLCSSSISSRNNFCWQPAFHDAWISLNYS